MQATFCQHGDGTRLLCFWVPDKLRGWLAIEEGRVSFDVSLRGLKTSGEQVAVGGGGILGLYRDNGKENGNYYNGLYNPKP